VGILLFNISSVYASAQSDIENSLMSPVHDTTLAVCSSSEAQKMKEEIRQKLAIGQTKSQIIKTYSDLYGEKILTSPPKKGFNLLAWVIPFLGIVMGGSLIYLALSKWVKAPIARKIRSTIKPGVLDDYYDARVEEEYKKHL
jgi:cytochrome c-type biogenesis protein CcmH